MTLLLIFDYKIMNKSIEEIPAMKRKGKHEDMKD